MKKTFEEYYPSLVINVRSITIDPLDDNNGYMRKIDINSGEFEALVHEGMVRLIKSSKTYRFFYFLPETTDQYIKIISFKIDSSMPV